VPSLATAALRAARPGQIYGHQPVLNGLLALFRRPVSYQGILEALPIRPDRFVTYQFGTYKCRKRGFPAARAGVRPSPGTVPPRSRGEGVAAARRSFRGSAGDRSQQHFSNIQSRIP